MTVKTPTRSNKRKRKDANGGGGGGGGTGPGSAAAPTVVTEGNSLQRQSDSENVAEQNVGKEEDEDCGRSEEAVADESIGKTFVDTVNAPTGTKGADHTALRMHPAAERNWDEFLKWCKQVLGIQTSLVVREFDYFDYLHEDDDEECDNDDYVLDDREGNMVKVRGLAASRDIEVGEVVISIPFHAMITVQTTIDHDPVLSRILGPEAREKFGWGGPSMQYYEIPLLIVALLYHRALGKSSPLFNYVALLLNTPVDAMPFLWDGGTLRREAKEGVRQIARAIKSDIKDMYDAVMRILIDEYPDVFGRPVDGSQDDWMYSPEKFQWAFAMVNSRHWNLPLGDLDAAKNTESEKILGADDAAVHQALPPTSTASTPPAEQPTEEWVQQQQILQDRHDNAALNDTPRPHPEPLLSQSHSFLAPVADLLNFGPPCVRGSYNTQAHAFELVSTCSFLAGQEVTFWYSDDCDDIIIANYGFTHPMVPRCLSLEDWRQRSDTWRSHAQALETELDSALYVLEELEAELKVMKAAMKECGCNVVTSERTTGEEWSWQQRPPGRAVTAEAPISEQQQQKLRRDRQGANDVGVRGSNPHGEEDTVGSSEEKGGIRSTLQRQRFNLGL